MSNLVKHANVYYLPPAVTAPGRPWTAGAECRPSRWSAVQRTLLRTWWRFRISLAEFRTLVGRRRLRALADDYLLLEDSVKPLERRRGRPRPSGPARLIDFEAARRRLRPAAV